MELSSKTELLISLNCIVYYCYGLQLESSLTDAPQNLRGLTDPSIRGTFAYESLRTTTELSISCLSKYYRERPSIEDVLWNLQYSVQVQEGWATSENLGTRS